jgi:hypothetical protein
MLSSRAMIIMEEGPMGVQSKEEVKDIILHHFGIANMNSTSTIAILSHS